MFGSAIPQLQARNGSARDQWLPLPRHSLLDLRVNEVVPRMARIATGSLMATDADFFGRTRVTQTIGDHTFAIMWRGGIGRNTLIPVEVAPGVAGTDLDIRRDAYERRTIFGVELLNRRGINRVGA